MFWHLFKTETFIQMHPILLLWIIIKPVTCIPQFHSIRMLQAIVVMRKCSEFNPLCLPSYDMTHKNGGILRFVHYSGKSFYVLVCKIHQPNLSHFEKKKSPGALFKFFWLVKLYSNTHNLVRIYSVSSKFCCVHWCNAIVMFVLLAECIDTFI